MLEPPKRKLNRLMMEVGTAIGQQDRKPSKRVASLASLISQRLAEKMAVSQKKFLWEEDF